MNLESIFKLAKHYESKGYDWKIVRNKDGFEFYLKATGSVLYQQMPSSMIERITTKL